MDFAVVQLSEDRTVIVTSIFMIKGWSPEWRTSDSSLWPKDEIEIFISATNSSKKGVVRFIGVEEDAKETANRISTMDNNSDLLQNSAILRELVSRLNDLERKVQALSEENVSLRSDLNFFKDRNIEKPKGTEVVGRHGVTITSQELGRALAAATDSKGFFKLVDCIPCINLKNLTWYTLPIKTKQIIDDLIVYYINARIDYEKLHPITSHNKEQVEENEEEDEEKNSTTSSVDIDGPKKRRPRVPDPTDPRKRIEVLKHKFKNRLTNARNNLKVKERNSKLIENDQKPC